jgi:ornithine--oxo-acid transaminase
MSGVNPRSTESIRGELIDRYVAKNYKPLPIIISKGRGVELFGIDGTRYFDFLSAYSAQNFGHLNPKLVEVAKKQLGKLTLTSRAFDTEDLGTFGRDLSEFCSLDRVLPMNTGAEAVETAIKLVRKYGYRSGRAEYNKANIIVCDNNFHGRTTTIVGFSSHNQYKDMFGPFYEDGFKSVPFGNIDALENAIDDNTVAFLVEPIQGEGGVIIPKDGYLSEVRDLCTDREILLTLDEIQTGFGRTGYDLAYQYERIRPDVLILGKALGGGLIPVSAVLADNHIMGVIGPGDHGSTFGGNPLACVVGRKVISMMKEDEISLGSRVSGEYLMSGLKKICVDFPNLVVELRGRGLMIGIEMKSVDDAFNVCLRLEEEKVLCNNAQNVVRISPPLIISEQDIDFALVAFRRVFERLSQ